MLLNKVIEICRVVMERRIRNFSTHVRVFKENHAILSVLPKTQSLS